MYSISTKGDGVYSITYKGVTTHCNLAECEHFMPGFTEYMNTYNWLQYLGAI